MKRFFSITIAALILFCLSGGMEAFAQRMILPSNLVGVNLKDVQKDYLRQINRGNEMLVAHYADALYYDGQIIQAFEMYMRADTLEGSLTDLQKRNYVHAAKRLDRSTPYDKQSDYFVRDMLMKAAVGKYDVNTSQEDFAPFVWNDCLFITSSRVDVNMRQQDTYAFTQLPYLAVYAFDSERRRMQTDFLPSLNTSLHDGPLAIAQDTSLVIITRNYSKPNAEQLQNLYMTYFVRSEGTWLDPVPFQFNDPSHSVQHPFYHDATKTLYFSSDMPGGFGGFDIYKTVWDGSDWSNPENIGPEINSYYDEVFPVISPEGDFYYTSNHIETHGGLDIILFSDGKRYLLPEPFNTVYDDLSITFADETTGYFASNRNQSVFNDDIYSFRHTPYPFIVRVLDGSSMQPLQGVRLTYRAENPVISGRADTGGAGEVQIHSGFEDAFMVQLSLAKDGYRDHEITSDAFVFADGRWVLTVYMEADVTVNYFVIYFDNDYPDPGSESEITSVSYDETYEMFKARRDDFFARSASDNSTLDAFFREVDAGMIELQGLAETLYEGHSKGQKFEIIFTSHASPLASDPYNLSLSKRRFHAVENYLLGWDNSKLVPFIERGMLLYENNPYGSQQASPNVSEDPLEPEKSIYGVDASRERKITITWRRLTD